MIDDGFGEGQGLNNGYTRNTMDNEESAQWIVSTITRALVLFRTKPPLSLPIPSHCTSADLYSYTYPAPITLLLLIHHISPSCPHNSPTLPNP